VADYVTFSGSGEPTLHSEIGSIIGAAKKFSRVPVAVLTNGSMLWLEEVRAQLVEADLLMPSLDAALPATFARLNRPAEGLSIERIIEGLRRAKTELGAAMWLEVMLVSGCNDSEADLRALREAIDYIEPDRVQINTPVRPPAQEVSAPSEDTLALAQEALGHKAEVIDPAREAAGTGLWGAQAWDAVVALIRRRPCTLADIAGALGMHPNEVAKVLRALDERGLIAVKKREGNTFYVAAGAG